MACDATRVVLPPYPVTPGTQSPHHEWKIYTVTRLHAPLPRQNDGILLPDARNRRRGSIVGSKRLESEVVFNRAQNTVVRVAFRQSSRLLLVRGFHHIAKEQCIDAIVFVP